MQLAAIERLIERPYMLVLLCVYWRQLPVPATVLGDPDRGVRTIVCLLLLKGDLHDVLLVLEVIAEVLVHFGLRQRAISLLLKETLCKSLILPLNPLVLSPPLPQVQRLRSESLR